MRMDVSWLIDVVAEKLKTSAKVEATTADVIEEFEDENGNVFNRKTYEGKSCFITIFQILRDRASCRRWR